MDLMGVRELLISWPRDADEALPGEALFFTEGGGDVGEDEQGVGDAVKAEGGVRRTDQRVDDGDCRGRAGLGVAQKETPVGEGPEGCGGGARRRAGRWSADGGGGRRDAAAGLRRRRRWVLSKARTGEGREVRTRSTRVRASRAEERWSCRVEARALISRARFAEGVVAAGAAGAEGEVILAECCDDVGQGLQGTGDGFEEKGCGQQSGDGKDGGDEQRQAEGVSLGVAKEAGKEDAGGW